jgi:hypothetical protein
MSPEVVAGQRMAYTREEYLRLADEYINDAITRLEGNTTINQSIWISEVFALLALATDRGEVSGQLIAEAVERAVHPEPVVDHPAVPGWHTIPNEFGEPVPVRDWDR